MQSKYENTRATYTSTDKHAEFTVIHAVSRETGNEQWCVTSRLNGKSNLLLLISRSGDLEFASGRLLFKKSTSTPSHVNELGDVIADLLLWEGKEEGPTIEQTRAIMQKIAAHATAGLWPIRSSTTEEESYTGY